MRYSRANKEKINAYRKEYYLKNIEEQRERHSKYRHENKEEISRKLKENKARYNETRKAKYQEDKVSRAERLVRNREYRQQRFNNSHPLHDKAEEKRLYILASELEEKNGFPYAVDHVFPLAKGGPHYHLNMQVIPASINSVKSDSLTFRHPDILHWSELSDEVLSFIEPDLLSQAYGELKGV